MNILAILVGPFIAMKYTLFIVSKLIDTRVKVKSN